MRTSVHEASKDTFCEHKELEKEIYDSEMHKIKEVADSNPEYQALLTKSRNTDGILDSETSEKFSTMMHERYTSSEGSSDEVVIDYTNYRGERGTRKIVPQKIFFGSNEWHQDEQWLLSGLDVVKNESRTFAMKDIHSWLPLG